MNARQIALALAAGRVVVGVALTLAPARAGAQWIGDEAQRPATQVFARALGIRDLALGLGTLRALKAGSPAGSWLQLAMLADAVDFAATFAAGSSIPASARLGTLAVAGSSAVVGAALIAQLD